MYHKAIGHDNTIIKQLRDHIYTYTTVPCECHQADLSYSTGHDNTRYSSSSGTMYTTASYHLKAAYQSCQKKQYQRCCVTVSIKGQSGANKRPNKSVQEESDDDENSEVTKKKKSEK